ncbi:MAG: fibronectin type III domain-containing protein, partial [Coriobacteriia bacterium]|nr:fibronectin type III domain-containing protein [Coriobacteriia bacterium]
MGGLGGASARVRRIASYALFAFSVILALVFAAPVFAGDGTLVDAGFEAGTDAAALSTPPWINVGTTLRREYDNTRAAAGTQSAWIQGPASASFAGVAESQSASMTADGSEIRFWLYQETTTTPRRFYDNIAAGGTYGSHLVLLAADGTIQVNMAKAALPAGYALGYNVVGTQSTGWTQYRITHDFSNQTITLSTRKNSSDAWTGLKSATAATYDIPMRGSATVTRTGGLAFSASTSGNFWLDELRYDAAGITDPVPDTTPPTSPAAGIAADVAADQGGALSLSWTPATDNIGVTGYKLYRGISAGTYDSVTTTTLTAANLSGLLTDTRYYFAVSALDAAGNEGEKSPEFSAVPTDDIAPAIPAGLSGSAQGANRVSVSWSANAESDLAGYDVYRDGVKINGALVTGTSYLDSGLATSTAYAYSVCARD